MTLVRIVSFLSTKRLKAFRVTLDAGHGRQTGLLRWSSLFAPPPPPLRDRCGPPRGEGLRDHGDGHGAERQRELAQRDTPEGREASERPGEKPSGEAAAESRAKL